MARRGGREGIEVRRWGWRGRRLVGEGMGCRGGNWGGGIGGAGARRVGQRGEEEAKAGNHGYPEYRSCFPLGINSGRKRETLPL